MRKKTEQEWIAEFEKQKSYIETLLYSEEEIKQCLDKDSFDGRYYNPAWVATSKGRVYSLWKKDWLSIRKKEGGGRNENGEYTGTKYFYVGGKVSAHGLTCNYFGDKKPIEVFGEKNVEVHHARGFDENKSLEENNCANCLNYIYTPTHRNVVNQIEDGKAPECSSMDIKIAAANVAYHEDTAVSYKVNGEGKEEITMSFKISSRFWSKKDEEFIEKHMRENPGLGWEKIEKTKKNEDGTFSIWYSIGEAYRYDVDAGIVTKI